MRKRKIEKPYDWEEVFHDDEDIAVLTSVSGFMGNLRGSNNWFFKFVCDLYKKDEVYSDVKRELLRILSISEIMGYGRFYDGDKRFLKKEEFKKVKGGYRLVPRKKGELNYELSRREREFIFRVIKYIAEPLKKMIIESKENKK